MELKAQFMANISHELRTPLSGVLGMAELLKEMPLTSDQEELVNYIYVSAAGLLMLLIACLTSRACNQVSSVSKNRNSQFKKYCRYQRYIC